jgi:hypothetical protein
MVEAAGVEPVSLKFFMNIVYEAKMLSFSAPVNVYENRGGNSGSPSNRKKEDITTFERYTKD